MGTGCFGAQNTAASAEYARQVSTANLRASQLEAQLADALARVDQLEEYVRTQGQSQATKLENLDQVNAEVVKLRGQIEVLEFNSEALTKRLETEAVQGERRQLHDERRLTQVEGFLGVDTPPAPTLEEMGLSGTMVDGTQPTGTTPTTPPDDGTATVPVEPATPADVPATARGKLDLAASHMREGRQPVARAILIRAKGEHADAPERAEIDFRIAETWLNEKVYSKAALAFKGVIDDHPSSGWAAWSMLHQGDCFAGLGQTDNARLFYDGVTQRYPKSEASKEARKRLGR